MLEQGHHERANIPYGSSQTASDTLCPPSRCRSTRLGRAMGTAGRLLISDRRGDQLSKLLLVEGPKSFGANVTFCADGQRKL